MWGPDTGMACWGNRELGAFADDDFGPDLYLLDVETIFTLKAALMQGIDLRNDVVVS